MSLEKESNLAIIVSSCDAFSECWKPFLYSLEKYWPDCPYPVYIISNFNKIDTSQARFVMVGEDKGFATNLRNALDQIPEEYVIYFQEDYFLNKQVSSEAIDGHFRHCIETGVDFLKLGDFTMLCDNERIGQSIYCYNPIGKKYSINTAIAIWKKSLLEQLLVPGWSGWDFEYQVIDLIKEKNIRFKTETLYSKAIAEHGITYIRNGAIVKGKWTKTGIDFLQENGMSDVISARKKLGPLTAYLYDHKKKSKIDRYISLGLISFMKKVKWNL